MGYRCDHCGKLLRPDPDGQLRDYTGSKFCDSHSGNHTWEGYEVV